MKMVKLQEIFQGKITRRALFKLGGLAVATAVAPKSAEGKITGKRLAMVIDLQRCAGCGTCIIACKNENNVQSSFFWANKIAKTEGEFPHVRYDFIPTLCNQCEKAPCVQVCPTAAMHKGYGDITMHNPDKCIGCKTCIAACPYGVISFNKKRPYKFWESDRVLIKGSTLSPQEVRQKLKAKALPYYNPDREGTLAQAGTRYKGIVEKCTFCDHRVKRGKLPYCVERCPAKARIFGDLNDPDSEVRWILGKYHPLRLKEHLRTEPKVFYVRSFNPGTYQKTRGSV
jgi:molybdopterin-containing oxidoreductase family iron-sulfur binding subunit